MTEQQSCNLPLLVVSCDKYADVWKPFFHVFRSRWPDCPFPLYLGTNHFTCEEPGVTTITVGDDKDWASGAITMLKQLDTTHVILFLEDFFFTEPVDTNAILRLVRVAQGYSPACLRLAPLPPPTPLPATLVAGFNDIGIVDKETPYLIATQPAIWRKDFLLKLLVPGFSAWEFEHLGSTICEFMDEEIWGPLVPYIVYEQGVEKGKWKQSALAICRDAGVQVDLTARPAFSDAELERHFSSGAVSAGIHELKMAAMRAYLHGRRMEGTKKIFRYLCRKPMSMQGWAMLAVGLLGPGALQRLRKKHLGFRMEQARRQATEC